MEFAFRNGSWISYANSIWVRTKLYSEKQKFQKNKSALLSGKKIEKREAEV